MEIFSTLIRGAAARRKDALTGQYAIELIDQKTRDAEQDLLVSKSTLAGLMARERQETRNLEMVQTRISELVARAKLALDDDNEELATQAANVIADLENEAGAREKVLAQIRSRITKLRFSVEKMHRRLIDLKQGVIAARAVRADHQSQKRSGNVGHSTSIREAETLVARVLEEQEPQETVEILDEIDTDLCGENLEERMAQAGYGTPNKVQAADVLMRLRKS